MRWGVLLLIIFLNKLSYCQLDTANIFLFGSIDNKSSVAILKSKNEAFYLIGNSGSVSRERSDITVIKTDTLLNLIWSKNFNFGSISNATAADTLSNGDIVISGFYQNMNTPFYGGLVFCIDSSGSFKWKIEIENENKQSSFVNSISATKNKIVFGGSKHKTETNKVGFIAITDYSGMNYEYIIENLEDFPQTLVKSDTIMSVSIGYPDSKSTTLNFFKSVNSNIIEMKHFKHNSILEINSFKFLNDSIFSIVGRKKRGNNDINGDNFIWHFDKNFNHDYFLDYGQNSENNQIVDIADLPNGNLIYSAEESGIGSGGKGIQIFEMSFPFIFYGGPTFGGTLDEFGGQLLVDNKWVYIFGNTESYNSEYFDFYLIRIQNDKIDLEYTLDIKRQNINVDLIEIPTNILNNKSLEKAAINYKNGLLKLENIPSKSHLVVYSITGKIVYSSLLESGEKTIAVSHFSSGIYVARLIGIGHQINSYKFLKYD